MRLLVPRDWKREILELKFAVRPFHLFKINRLNFWGHRTKILDLDFLSKNEVNGSKTKRKGQTPAKSLQGWGFCGYFDMWQRVLSAHVCTDCFVSFTPPMNVGACCSTLINALVFWNGIPCAPPVRWPSKLLSIHKFCGSEAWASQLNCKCSPMPK